MAASAAGNSDAGVGLFRRPIPARRPLRTRRTGAAHAMRDSGVARTETVEQKKSKA